ncbi:MAG: histidine kinase [Bacteroidia bacterium]|nr:histidine kinase [Bacteroidia bacterium]
MASASTVFASDAVPVTTNTFSQLITANIDYKLVDEQWQDGGVYADTGWKANNHKALNIGLKRKGIWIRFGLDHTAHSDSLIALIENPFIDQAEIYTLEQQKLVLQSTDGLNRVKRKKDSFQVLPFEVDSSGTTQMVYLYVRTDLEPTISLWIQSFNEYRNGYTSRLSFFSILTGVFVVIFLYNLFLFWSIRDWVYVFYSLYVLGTYFAQTITSSLGYHALGAAGIMTEGKFIFLAVGFVAITSGVFLISFFKGEIDKPKNKSAYLTFASFPVIGMSFILLAFLVPRYYVFWYMNFGMILLSLAIFYATITLYRNGAKQAKFILWAWSPFLLGAIIFMLSNAGVVEHSRVTQYAMPIGASIETVLLSFAVGYRIAMMKRERRQNQLKALEQTNKFQQLELDMTKTKLLALRSQMNPHFIFNALNSVHYSVQEKDSDKAQDLIHRFARLMRTMLVHARSESVTVKEEVEFLKDYLDVEQKRNDDLFSYEFHVDEDLVSQNMRIPSTMIQPICESAIKHAFVYSAKDENLLTVRFRKGELEDTVEVEISDNGIEIHHARKMLEDSALGLSIIEERISLLHSQGKRANLEMVSNRDLGEGMGTTVTVVLPIY